MKKGRNNKIFQVYSAEEFIAAISQPIPDKLSQRVKCFAWYKTKHVSRNSPTPK